MNSRFTLRLDGISLTDAVPGAYITDIREEPPEMVRRILQLAGGGSRVVDERRIRLSVTVTLALREENPVTRQTLGQQLMRWCTGTRLEMNTRPSCWLPVRCTLWPKLPSALHWTDPLSVTFTAVEVPFWVHTDPVQMLREGALWDKLLAVPGTAPSTPMDAVLRNEGTATCNTVALTCNSDMLHFTSLALAPGEALRITHDATDRLQLTIRAADGTDRSAFPHRSLASSNDLWARCGDNNDISLAADAPLSALLTVYGREL